ncbi:iron chelate uptake ABC transporter family permease subunit [Amycolatopsis sp. NBRC 101858]|uniref:iron chelate uptake ABC transporter family permease subunit n=1 Tax=Amycolatopsis sp. NBRC 101858 TaxID=3032200 RepID=UPI00333A83BE
MFGFSRSAGRIQAGRMVMTGIAVGQLLSGVISFLLLRTHDVDAQQQILFWILGSLAGAQWPLALTCAGGRPGTGRGFGSGGRPVEPSGARRRRRRGTRA